MDPVGASHRSFVVRYLSHYYVSHVSPRIWIPLERDHNCGACCNWTNILERDHNSGACCDWTIPLERDHNSDAYCDWTNVTREHRYWAYHNLMSATYHVFHG